MRYHEDSLINLSCNCWKIAVVQVGFKNLRKRSISPFVRGFFTSIILIQVSNRAVSLPNSKNGKYRTVVLTISPLNCHFFPFSNDFTMFAQSTDYYFLLRRHFEKSMIEQAIPPRTSSLYHQLYFPCAFSVTVDDVL